MAIKRKGLLAVLAVSVLVSVIVFPKPTLPPPLKPGPAFTVTVEWVSWVSTSVTGMTAWAGLNLVEVKAGDVVFISGAASAVGNVAGQLAKLRGCKVIGSAGSMEKVMFLREECGFDIAFDYKTGPVLEQLNLEAPDGIDVYFDNVGGETLEAALSALRVHGRIIACGGISGYNNEKPRPGPSNLFNMTTKRLGHSKHPACSQSKG